MILPGKTIGMLGGGQLGRMTAQAARSLGYNFVVFEPSPNCPASQVADQQITADYTDIDALLSLGKASDVISYEFENVSTDALDKLAEVVPLYPNTKALHICQNREREKAFLKENDFPHAPFEIVNDPESLSKALKTIGAPCVLKTASFGYDGKGQQKIDSLDADVNAIWKAFDGKRAVLEGWIEFDIEVSVMVSVGSNGESKIFPVSENIHTNHILDLSIVPARIDKEIRSRAESLACEVAQKLGIIGLLGVELFVLKNGEIVINELAPRPHNSGHYTLDGCATNQFEQFVRAICGLPLGSTELIEPIVMVNILGDSWENGDPNFAAILEHPKAKLHLYGKSGPQKGRKMGHFTVSGKTVEEAFEGARYLKNAL
ncbi:5-(carboxyamino)imidazole ribonucleotide synthase [Puniceicoccaceae bacterium K14]|nr:5-(carboxyamino)imidazole ribonucleotide synthase [Puniceicoccaceae bacterium K14]